MIEYLQKQTGCRTNSETSLNSTSKMEDDLDPAEIAQIDMHLYQQLQEFNDDGDLTPRIIAELLEDYQFQLRHQEWLNQKRQDSMNDARQRRKEVCGALFYFHPKKMFHKKIFSERE